MELLYPQRLAPATSSAALPLRRALDGDKYELATARSGAAPPRAQSAAALRAALQKRGGAPSTAVVKRRDGLLLLDGCAAALQGDGALRSHTAHALMRASVQAALPPSALLRSQLPDAVPDLTGAAPALAAGLPRCHRSDGHVPAFARAALAQLRPTDEDLARHREGRAAAAAAAAADLEAGEVSDGDAAGDSVRADDAQPLADAPLADLSARVAPTYAATVAAAAASRLRQDGAPRQRRFLPLPRAVPPRAALPGCGFAGVTDVGPPPQHLAQLVQHLVAQVLRGYPSVDRQLDFQHKGLLFKKLKVGFGSACAASVCNVGEHSCLVHNAADVRCACRST